MTVAAITTEIQKLQPSAVVELFELDATSFGGDLLRFHAGTNGLTSNVVWQGNTYTAFPISASGFDFSGNGQLPRPKLLVANITGAISLLVMNFDDLLGAKLTRRRTMIKYLDGANFPGGTNPTADDTAEFPDDVFFIDRKALETRDAVEFELAAAFDVAGVRLPRRQMIQNVCVWKYKGTECGWSKTTDKSGTYARSATTVTVTSAAHGLSVGDAVYVDFTSGLAVDGKFTVATVPAANTFTFTHGTSGTTSGSCNITQLYDANDLPVYDISGDVCGKRLTSCKARFGDSAPLPFGSFPSAGLVR